jgi:hypothetical protein
VARDRERTRQAIEAMGGRYSPNGSSSSEGTREDRDNVESSLNYANLQPRSDMQAPQTAAPDERGRYEVTFDPRQVASSGLTHYGAATHEAGHIMNDVSFNRGDTPAFTNMNLPADESAMQQSARRQLTAMTDNMGQVRTEAGRDLQRGRISERIYDHIDRRVEYSQVQPGVEYPTVVSELREYMRQVRPDTYRDTRAYQYLNRLNDAIRPVRVSGQGEHRTSAPLYRGPVHRTQDYLRRSGQGSGSGPGR